MLSKHSQKRVIPRKFSELLAARVCEMVAQGKSLKDICKLDGMPARETIMRWVMFPDEDTMPGFSQRFKEARQIGWMLMGEDILDISDDASKDTLKKPMKDRFGNPIYKVQPEKDEKGVIIKAGVLAYAEMDNPNNLVRAKLMVETRKWMLQRLLPAVFGDKIAVTHGISEDLAARLDAARARLDLMQAQPLIPIPTTQQIEGLIEAVAEVIEDE